MLVKLSTPRIPARQPKTEIQMKEIKANKVGLLASINRLYQEPLSGNILTWVSFRREIVWYDPVNRTGT